MQYIKDKIDLLLKDKGKKMPEFLAAIEMSETGYYASIKNSSVKVATLEKAAEFFEVQTAFFFSGIAGTAKNNTATNSSGTKAKAKVVLELDLDDSDILNLKLKDRVWEMFKK